jgi:hypothetical protein
LNWAEFNVTALRRCRRGTSSVTNDCHAATVNPPANELSVSIRRNNPMWRSPEIQMPQRMNVIAAWMTPPTIRTLRRSNRSATEPA